MSEDESPQDEPPPSGPPDTVPASSGDLLPVIPAGEAQLRVSQALDALAGAYLRLEGVAMAIARQLDATK